MSTVPSDVEAMCDRLDNLQTTRRDIAEALVDAKAMLRSLSKDAERYRFLRAVETIDLQGAVKDATGVWTETEDEIDAAIDAALAAKPTTSESADS